MPHNFGLHVASEVVEKATAFENHVHDAGVWRELSDPHRGRMTKADADEGKKRLAAAVASLAKRQQAGGLTHEPTSRIDSADEACAHWLADQSVHVRGALHEAGDRATLAAFDALFASSRGHQAHVDDVRAYAKAARAGDALGKAISATYSSPKARDAILKDGEHLADALAAQLGDVDAARGAGKTATTEKDAAIDALARWLHRWSLVAHRVCSPASLSALGLASARHHPEHRAHHPAHAAQTTPPAASPPAP